MKKKQIKCDYSYLDDYYQKGGTYVLPIEIVNDLRGELEDHENCKIEIAEANDSATWWRNRYTAQYKINCDFKHLIENVCYHILKEAEKNHGISYEEAIRIREELLNGLVGNYMKGNVRTNRDGHSKKTSRHI